MPDNLSLALTSPLPVPNKNIDWSVDELILALHLYITHPDSLPGKTSVEIKELSTFLNKMGAALDTTMAEKFRNANGVYMKMMNFRRFDPKYINEGKVGLKSGNKNDKVVWDNFANDPERLKIAATDIRSSITTYTSGELRGIDEPEIVEAEEGRVLTRLHRYRERSPILAKKFKKKMLEKHGKLACEACGFEFSEQYGTLYAGIIDVHHTKPVHTLVEGDKTRLEDLALLCCNCHRVVHSKAKWLAVDELKKQIRKSSS